MHKEKFKLENSVGKVLDKTEVFLAAIAGILIMCSMLTVMLEVIVRYIFGTSFVWVQEYNEYILLYIPFLSGAWLLRNNDHVIVNLIDNILGKSSSIVLNIIVAILGILSMIIIVYYSTIVTLDILNRNVTSTTVLRTPQVYIYIIIPIGSFFMLLEFVRQLIYAIKSRNNSLLE